MLVKLLKYDLKSILKFLIIFYSLAMFFGVLTRVFLSIENSLIMNIIGEIFSGAAISMMFSIVINNLMRMWVRFKQNLYGDESYLTHTLPIEKKTLYLSKFLTAIITLFISVAVIVLTLLTAYYSKENMKILKSLLLPIADMYNSSLLGLLSEISLVLFLEFVNILQCGFTGIILGHRKNTAKTGSSVLFGFISFMVSQTLVVLMVFAAAIFNKDLMNLFFTNNIVNVESLKTVIYIAITIYFIIAVIGVLFNIKLFKKGVNVD